MSLDGKLDGYWVLVDKTGNNTELYTKVYADIYIDKSTNEKYTRGKVVAFIRRNNKPEYPPFIENTGIFEFITKPQKPQKPQQGNINIKEEIYVGKILDILFKKK